MNKEQVNELRKIHQLWITNLRSGNFEQGYSQLCNSNQYCCLGVLATTIDYDLKTLHLDFSLIPERINSKYGKLYSDLLSLTHIQGILISMNDGFSFSDINDKIDYSNVRYSKIAEHDFEVDSHSFEEIADFLQNNTDYIFSKGNLTLLQT